MIKINKIKLNNFRCYDEYECSFSEKINIIHGNNATGKTSIVESISLLSTGKSFKTNVDKDLIKFGKELYYNVYYIEKDLENIQLKITSDGKAKKIIINNKTIKSISSFVGIIKTIVFSPDDERIITDDPKKRRKFLDKYLSIIDKKYLKILIDYNKVLKERNELLKSDNIIDDNLLSIYNNKLICDGKTIIKKRKEFIDTINIYFNEKINVLSCGVDCGKLVYKPNVDFDDIEDVFLRTINYDLISKTTNCGPHRDDFYVILNDNEAMLHGSKGQIKTLALSLILSIVDIFREIDDNLVVILDDVFGELDNTRQEQILKLLDNKYQLFITTTSINSINSEIIQKSKTIKTEREDI